MKYLEVRVDPEREPEIHDLLSCTTKKKLLNRLKQCDPEAVVFVKFHHLRYLKESVDVERRTEPAEVVEAFGQAEPKKFSSIVQICFERCQVPLRQEVFQSLDKIFSKEMVEGKTAPEVVFTSTAHDLGPEELKTHFSELCTAKRSVRADIAVNLAALVVGTFVDCICDLIKNSGLEFLNLPQQSLGKSSSAPDDTLKLEIATTSNVLGIAKFYEDLCKICTEKRYVPAESVREIIQTALTVSTTNFQEYQTVFANEEFVTLSVRPSDYSSAKVVVRCLQKLFCNDTKLLIQSSVGVAVLALHRLHFTEEFFQTVAAKPLRDFLLTAEFRTELAEITACGAHYICQLTEKKPFPIFTIALVGSVAAIEIAIGITLVATLGVVGYGGSVGIGLITDGAMEVFTIGQTAYKRELNVMFFLIAKVASIGCTFATAGISQAAQMKRAANSIRTTVLVVKEASEDALAAVGKTVISSAMTDAVNRVAATVGREAVTRLVSATFEGGIDVLIPMRLQQMKDQLDTEFFKRTDDFIKRNQKDLREVFVQLELLDQAAVAELLFRFREEVRSATNAKFCGTVSSHLNMLSDVTTMAESLLENIQKIVDSYREKRGFKETYSKYLEIQKVDFRTSPDDLKQLVVLLTQVKVLDTGTYTVTDLANVNTVLTTHNWNAGIAEHREHVIRYFEAVKVLRNKSYDDHLGTLGKELHQMFVLRALSFLEQKYGYLKMTACFGCSFATGLVADAIYPVPSGGMVVSAAHGMVNVINSYVSGPEKPAPCYVQQNGPVALGTGQPGKRRNDRADKIINDLFGPATNTLLTPDSLRAFYSLQFDIVVSLHMFGVPKDFASGILYMICHPLVCFAVLCSFFFYMKPSSIDHLKHGLNQGLVDVTSVVRHYTRNRVFWEFLQARAENLPVNISLVRDGASEIFKPLITDELALFLRSFLLNKTTFLALQGLIAEALQSVQDISIISQQAKVLLTTKLHAAEETQLSLLAFAKKYLNTSQRSQICKCIQSQIQITPEVFRVLCRKADATWDVEESLEPIFSITMDLLRSENEATLGDLILNFSQTDLSSDMCLKLLFDQRVCMVIAAKRKALNRLASRFLAHQIQLMADQESVRKRIIIALELRLRDETSENCFTDMLKVLSENQSGQLSLLLSQAVKHFVASDHISVFKDVAPLLQEQHFARYLNSYAADFAELAHIFANHDYLGRSKVCGYDIRPLLISFMKTVSWVDLVVKALQAEKWSYVRVVRIIPLFVIIGYLIHRLGAWFNKLLIWAGYREHSNLTKLQLEAAIDHSLRKRHSGIKRLAFESTWIGSNPRARSPIPFPILHRMEAYVPGWARRLLVVRPTLDLGKFLFSEVSFVNSTLENVSFQQAIFHDVSFIGASLRNVSFYGATIDDKTLRSLVDAIRNSKSRVTLDHCTITGDLSSIDLSNISLVGANLAEVKSLENANVRGTNLSEVKFPANKDLLVKTRHFTQAQTSVNDTRDVERNHHFLIDLLVACVFKYVAVETTTKINLRNQLRTLLQNQSIGAYLADLLQSSPEAFDAFCPDIDKCPFTDVKDYVGKTWRLVWLVKYYKNSALTANGLIVERLSDRILSCLFGKGNRKGQEAWDLKRKIHDLIQKTRCCCEITGLQEEAVKQLLLQQLKQLWAWKSGEPEQGLPEQGLPEQGLPEQDLPEQDLPEQDLPEQDLPEQDLPEQVRDILSPPGILCPCHLT